ncbi:SRPBCC family protein [Streptomyces sp. SBT349]|uniref:SRPBCC family protein n=1 Tax=Streptomyces sp. SBT349 TaxID=1580539 RepID=UPI001F2E5DD3|nr:SRPBCC family protein [Streptomyces sp. SBT349]
MSDVAKLSPSDRVRLEAAAFAAVQAERLLLTTAKGLGRATAKLTDIAEGRSTGLVNLAAETGKRTAQGKGVVRSAVEAGAVNLASGVKDKVTSAVPKPHMPSLPKPSLHLPGLGSRSGEDGKGQEAEGARSKGEKADSGFLTIVEDIDIGVPVREAYDQWTQFQEFSGFAKGVQGVDQVDDTTTTWRAKVFLSKRSWQATITEQIPDERIAWTSEGGKGTTKGVVTFHRLGETLTRVLLVIEYYPKGLMERTGALWRAQGRRARLDLKNFRRTVMLRAEATGEWRGEIRHGEVEVTHEDAVEDAEERDHDERDDEEPRGGGRRS